MYKINKFNKSSLRWEEYRLREYMYIETELRLHQT